MSPMASDSRLNRFIVTTTSMLIIWRGPENKVLGWSVLVYIGDISYSVYLVHWPLFELYKYMNVQLFASFGKGTLFSGEFLKFKPLWTHGLAFFLIFITLGLIIEMVFVNLGQRLRCWRNLCGVIFILYAMIFLNLTLLSLNAIDLDVSETTNLMARKEVSIKAIEFMENFDVPEHLPKQESLEWAKNFHGYSIRLRCNSREIPTNFLNKTAMGDLNQKPCVVRGNGTKTMVVFGNSHARASFYGIVNQFKDVIKEATLMFQNGCNFVGANSTDIHAQLCKGERRAILPMLRAWKYPIDIIIFVHAYSAKDQPITGSLKQDQLYQEMIAFFGNLHKIAREVLIIPTVHFDSGFYTYLSVFRRKITFGEDLKVFRVPIKYAVTLHPHTRHRISAVECNRCLKVDFSKVWCRETEELCETVDQDRQIPFFYDRHHVNTYGSLFVGRYLRDQYDEWLRRN
ncbi:O-acetyltransferase OatA [Aphelenchoides bicaudatus]|nr:O-acetyltransferase OatA [Aphelenchoides bicaudatus]